MAKQNEQLLSKLDICLRQAVSFLENNNQGAAVNQLEEANLLVVSQNDFPQAPLREYNHHLLSAIEAVEAESNKIALERLVSLLEIFSSVR